MFQPPLSLAISLLQTLELSDAAAPHRATQTWLTDYGTLPEEPGYGLGVVLVMCSRRPQHYFTHIGVPKTPRGHSCSVALPSFLPQPSQLTIGLIVKVRASGIWLILSTG